MRPYVQRTGPVSERERDLIALMAETGRSTEEIARRLRRDPGTVYYHRVVAGCPPPSLGNGWGGRQGKLFEDEIVPMRRAGAGIREIGRASRRAVSTVWLQLHRLAATEECS